MSVIDLNWIIMFSGKSVKSIWLCGMTYLIFCITGCGSDVGTPDWEWSDSSTVSKDTTEKPRYIWIDAAANFSRYANNKDNIRTDLAQVKDAGFTDIVVDVRPTTGDVLFRTDLVDQVSKLDVWDGSTYLFYERKATWDYLQAFIDIGHELGLRVHASINTFVGGTSYLYGLGDPQGLLFRDDSKKDWATTLNLTSGLVNEMDLSDDLHTTRFLNPVNEEVQAYVLDLLGDLAKYDLDGIVLDRCRFDDLSSDFSDYTRSKFESYINKSVTDFPNDVVVPGTRASSLPSTLPVYFKKWLEFRAKTVHDFIVKAGNEIKSVNSDINLEVYVGGWYSTYFDSGVNWASPDYNTVGDYSWATSDYKNYGYADHLDFLLLGAYAPANAIYGNNEWTVQGFCKQARSKLLDAVDFAGGPDVGNWIVPSGTNAETAVTNTVDACMSSSGGYFLFDISAVGKYNYWPSLKNGIDEYLESIE